MSERWIRNPAVVSRRIAGETVLVPVRGALADLERLYLLNETGAAIWERLDGATDLDAIAAAIAEEYDVPPAQALADARQLVEQLAGGGLAEPSGERPCPAA